MSYEFNKGKKNLKEEFIRHYKLILLIFVGLMFLFVCYKIGYQQAVTDMTPKTNNVIFEGGFWNVIRSVGYQASIIFAIICFGIGQILHG